MVLGISEDFSSEVTLDTELKELPSSGLFLNSGVHPSITVDNLLNFLPNPIFTFADWSAETDYDVFLIDRDKKNVVSKGTVIYQSIKSPNLNQDPETETDYWLATNLESLKLKIFNESVKDKVYSDLSLTKRLVNNAYLYEVGETVKELPNDYCGWVIEPKGSDYVTIRINEMFIQKDGTTPVDVYVINQNELIETIQLTPDEGRATFSNTNIVFSGKGQFKLIIDSTDVYVGNGYVDPLKYDGFTAYTTIGTGDSPESASYTYHTSGNGIGLNITAFLSATNYIDNNLSELGNYIRATFEYMVFQLFLHNSSNRSNRVQRIQMDDQILMNELKNIEVDTVVSRYYKEMKRAITAMQKTFDTQLNDHDGIQVEISSI